MTEEGAMVFVVDDDARGARITTAFFTLKNLSRRPGAIRTATSSMRRFSTRSENEANGLHELGNHQNDDNITDPAGSSRDRLRCHCALI